MALGGAGAVLLQINDEAAQPAKRRHRHGGFVFHLYKQEEGGDRCGGFVVVWNYGLFQSTSVRIITFTITYPTPLLRLGLTALRLDPSLESQGLGHSRLGSACPYIISKQAPLTALYSTRGERSYLLAHCPAPGRAVDAPMLGGVDKTRFVLGCCCGAAVLELKPFAYAV